MSVLSSNGFHVLKCHPQNFRAILSGKKPWEVRVNDRNFRLDDVLYLREWDPESKEYTGRTTTRRVTYLSELDKFGAKGFVGMTIRET